MVCNYPLDYAILFDKHNLCGTIFFIDIHSEWKGEIAKLKKEVNELTLNWNKLKNEHTSLK